MTRDGRDQIDTRVKDSGKINFQIEDHLEVFLLSAVTVAKGRALGAWPEWGRALWSYRNHPESHGSELY